MAEQSDLRVNPAHPVAMNLGGAQAAQAVGCDLTVRFGGVGTGTVTVAGARIARLIEEDPGVAQIALGRSSLTRLGFGTIGC